MERVALELQRTAINRRGQIDDFDQFGRSAFNRYYYAVFLIVRDLMLEFNPRWSGSHASIPGMLRASVHDEIALRPVWKVLDLRSRGGRGHDAVEPAVGGMGDREA